MSVCFPKHKHSVIAIIGVVICLFGLYTLSHTIEAATTDLSPNADVVTDWSAQGTGDGTCGASLCDLIDDAPNTPDTSRYIRSSSGGNVAQFDIATFPTERGATGITVHIYVRNNSIVGSEADDISLRVDMPGGNTSDQQIQVTNTDWQWHQVSWTGTYSQNDIDNMQPRLQQIMRRDCFLNLCAGDDTLDLATIYTTVDYIPFAELDQSAYRVYQNADADSPGAPVAATNEIGDIPGQGSAFRLRMLATVNVNEFLTGEFSYRLQIAEKITSCATASYNDVTASTGPIQFFDNPSVTDGASAASSVDDPASPNSITRQSYHESNPVGSDQNALQGNDILWDFTLYDAGTEPNEIYCFRLVYDDGTPLENYSTYPEVRTVGNLTVSVVDTEGQSLPGTGITMSPTVVLTKCQTTNGTLGIPEQRLQITNDLVTEGWGVSIAASGGPSALWTAGTPDYDYNDPAGSPSGCAAGIDNDTSAGQMSVDPGSSSITPSESCSTAGVSAAPATAFDEDETDIIDLVNGSSSSERFCNFFVEGINVEQTIPAEQPMGTYSIDMTLTIVAF